MDSVVTSRTELHEVSPPYSQVSKDLNFEWNYTQLKFKLGTVKKNESTIGLPAGIEPTLLQCRWNALATELQR